MSTAPDRLSVTFFDAYPHVLGGSHQVLLTIASELRPIGSVHFLTTAEGPFTTELDRLRFPWTVVPLPQGLMSYGHTTRGRKALVAASLLPAAWKQVRRCIPRPTAVVHANDLRGALLAGPAARTLRIPAVWHVHLGDRNIALNRFAACAVSAIVVPDGSTVQSAPGLPSRKLRVVPNAVQHDVLEASPVPRGRYLLVTASRLVPQKGLDLLLEAVASVRSSFPELRLHIYGGEQKGYEDYAWKTRSQAAELGLDAAVTMKGHRDHPYRYWSDAAIYVQASRWENYPVAVLEAMAVGLPVVATDVGAMPQIVEHGRTGLLVAPGDPAALAKAITQLLENPDDAAAMGAAGRERVLSDFAPSIMANRMISIYQSLASSQK